MTVEQVWEYGKERGHEWYSPVTSLDRIPGRQGLDLRLLGDGGCELRPASGALHLGPEPFINEFKWGAKEALR